MALFRIVIFANRSTYLLLLKIVHNLYEICQSLYGLKFERVNVQLNMRTGPQSPPVLQTPIDVGRCNVNTAISLSAFNQYINKTIFRLFAEFELCYVSAMVNVKTPHEFEAQQLICVLYSESLRRALKQNLLTQEQVRGYFII